MYGIDGPVIMVLPGGVITTAELFSTGVPRRWITISLTDGGYQCSGEFMRLASTYWHLPDHVYQAGYSLRPQSKRMIKQVRSQLWGWLPNCITPMHGYQITGGG